MRIKNIWAAIGAVIFLLLESFTCALYLYLQNMLKDILWALPLTILFGILSIICWNEVYGEKKK